MNDKPFGPIERVEKGDWVVELYSNGAIYITGWIFNRGRTTAVLPKGDEVKGVPPYIARIVREIRQSHPEIWKIGE
jgi:hypothetical protein